jgi:hypothetical protein
MKASDLTCTSHAVFLECCFRLKFPEQEKSGVSFAVFGSVHLNRSERTQSTRPI